MQFGTVTTVIKYVDGKPITTKITRAPSVKIATEQEALSQFLTQLDLYRKGEIGSFGISCYVDSSKKIIYRVEPWYDNLKGVE